MFGVSVSLGSGTIATLISVFRHFDVCVLNDIPVSSPKATFSEVFAALGSFKSPLLGAHLFVVLKQYGGVDM